MGANEIQQTILKTIEDTLREHPRSHYVADEAIAEALGLELQLVRDYLELMRQNDYLTVSKTFGGWSAGLTAKGRVTLEDPTFLQSKPQGTALHVSEDDDVQSKMAALNSLLQRTYDLVEYARSRRDSAPIALADRCHPDHVEYDSYFCRQRDRLLGDVKSLLLKTCWDAFEYNRFQSRLEHFNRSIPPGQVPGWKGLARCRCWWDARDELEEVADYLHDLKSGLAKEGTEETTTQVSSVVEEEGLHDSGLASLRRQLAEARQNLRLIEERKSQFVMATDIPLQLIKEEQYLLKRTEELEQRVERLGTTGRRESEQDKGVDRVS